MFCSKRVFKALSSSSRCFFESVTFAIFFTQEIRIVCKRKGLCLLLHLSPPYQPPNHVTLPHPQSRKDHDRNENKPCREGIAWNFVERAINIAQYREGKDDVNPAKDPTCDAPAHHIAC